MRRHAGRSVKGGSGGDEEGGGGGDAKEKARRHARRRKREEGQRRVCGLDPAVVEADPGADGEVGRWAEGRRGGDDGRGEGSCGDRRGEG